MLIKSKFLSDAGWKDLAARNKVKDNGLVKSLEQLRRADAEAYDDQAKILDEAVKLIAALKKDKAVSAAPAVVKYVAEMQGDAELALREVAKARAEQEKAAKAKADAEKAAARKAGQDDEDDEDDASPELLTTKLKPLLKLVAKGETMHALLAKSGKQVVVMLSRKPIPPARRKILAEQLGGGSTKYYPGTCGLERGATTFALKAEVAGMSKLVKAALLEQTGLRLNRIKCRGEDGDDHDDEGDDVPAPEGKPEGKGGDATTKPLAAAPDEPRAGGRSPGAPTSGSRQDVPTLLIEPASGGSQVLQGSTAHFRAIVGIPNYSRKDVTREVTWESSDSAVSVSDLGAAEIKVGPGPLTISATHAKTGLKGSITVTVVARKMEKIVITPRNPLIEVDEFFPLRATAEFSDGTFEDVTDRVKWASNHDEFARPDSTGRCAGRAPGKAIIHAYDVDTLADGITEVTVHAAGKGPKLMRIDVTPIDPKLTGTAPLQLTAMGHFADNSRHEVTRSRGIRWISSRREVLAVDDNGLATPGLASAVVRITAANEDGSVYGYTEVDVQVPVLQAIDITPRDPALRLGDSVVLAVTGTFSSGPPRDITDRVVWTSAPTGVVAPGLSPGEIQSVRQGPCDLTATAQGTQVTDTVAVTVTPPEITAIDITPGGDLKVRAQQAYVATARLSDGSTAVLGAPDLRWTSSDPATLSIDGHSGLATAKAPGPATITVRTANSRVPGTLAVTVQPIVTKVQITPQRWTLPVGGTVQLTATAELEGGKTEDRTDSAWWVVVPQSSATIDKGFLTATAAAPAPDGVIVSATIDAEIGTANVIVTP